MKSGKSLKARMIEKAEKKAAVVEVKKEPKKKELSKDEMLHMDGQTDGRVFRER